MTSRMYKSSSDRMLFGVSGGLADYLDVDPTLVRLGWIVLGIVTAGFAILAYIVLAIVMPEPTDEADTGDAGDGAEDESSHEDSPAAPRRRRGRGFGVVAGAALIVLGVLFLGVNLNLVAWVDWGIVWPVVLILLGLLLIARRYRGG